MLENIKVEGRVGTWYEVDNIMTVRGRLYLLESEQYGDDAGWLLVDENMKEITETWDGIMQTCEDEDITVL